MTSPAPPAADAAARASGLEAPADEPTVAAIVRSIERHVKYSICRPPQAVSNGDLFTAAALSVRDLLVEAMLETDQRLEREDAKVVNYLSIEFLIGRSLGAHLDSLKLHAAYREALRRLGADLDTIEKLEPEAALGNGGLGRLAACFLDSLATLEQPAWGYGINYEYGLFKQEIRDGHQEEKPDHWLAQRSPWQIERADEACMIPVYGRIEHAVDRAGEYNPMWLDWQLLIGVPHDMLIPGYGGRFVQRLRLYSARSSHTFDIRIFNGGDYLKAVERQIDSEKISKVLYPSDAGSKGKELRLLQEYFLVACAMRDIVRRFERNHGDLTQFPQKVAIQMNDTHPALSVVELMRLLVDEKAMAWDEAWHITREALAYTNHTLAPEALERWPAQLLEVVLPRHLQIIREIDRRFAAFVMSSPRGSEARLARFRILDESRGADVRMSHLAMAGSHRINGVSVLHSELVKTQLAPEFHELFPERFCNVTNGVSPRRWLLGANPGLAELITSRIGPGWVTDLERLRELEGFATDPRFQSQFREVRKQNKHRLAGFISSTLHIEVAEDSIFDVHIKRIHAYKRQLLKLLHVVREYVDIIDMVQVPLLPKTYVFAGKAAPGYTRAKQIIKLINSVGSVINADPRAKPWLKVVFIPDYRVSLAEIIIPAADVGEQVSTSGTEASGTSNMKLALNGALLVATPDGANLEVRDEVGEENIFMFGHTVTEVRELRERNAYNPAKQLEDPRLRRVVETFASELFSPEKPGLFRWVRDVLLDPNDEHVHLFDLPSYLEAQGHVATAYRDPAGWAARAIRNVARSGKFSSDRAVREYAREVWGIGTA